MQRTATRGQVRQHVGQMLSSFGVDANATESFELEELELDSMDMLELAQIVEDDYGVEISADDAASLQTLDQFIDLIVARLAVAA
jgi:acyl carrier protein